MKTIKVGILETITPEWRIGGYKKYVEDNILSIWIKEFNNYNFIIVNDIFNNICDICLYDMYSIKFEELDYIFDQVKNNPIFLLDHHFEYPNYPDQDYDTLSKWTNNFKNYSISTYKDSNTNLFYPFIDFYGILENLERRKKCDINIKNKFALWIASNSTKIRKNKIDYINDNYKHIDYFGKVGKELKEGYIHRELYSLYKFNFAFENTFTNDNFYITEKICNGYENNVIPIYCGCSNVIDFFNPDSFINVCNMTNEQMIKEIQKVDDDFELYKYMFYQYPFKDKNFNYIEYYYQKAVMFYKNILNNI